MHVTYLIFIFALITRSQTKPALDFYGKSIEYDKKLPGPQPFFQPNELNNELNLEKEFQVWNNGEETATNNDQNPTVEKKFFKICEQFELILHTELEQKKIDCSSLEFVPKTTHPVIKRHVEREIDASGDGEVEVPNENVPEKEPTEENQSNITNQEIKEDKHSKHEITDVKNKLSKQSESIKTAPVQEDNAQESTEKVSKASKDTNILICLFVAVGGVAVGAFAYNYLKKRRKNDAAHRVENVENVEKNSTGKGDVELKEEEEKMLETKEETTENEDSNKAELDVEKKVSNVML